MGDWQLAFRGSQRLDISRWEELLSAVIGAVTTTYDVWRGNPRDFYSRSITLTGRRDDVRVELRLLEHQRGPGDPERFIDPSPDVTLFDTGARFATKLAIWHALRDALATIGCVDTTSRQQGATRIEDVGEPAIVPEEAGRAIPGATRPDEAGQPVTTSTEDGVWAWAGVGTFNPRFDARASAEGLSYGCEIQGPFCGYDAAGQQSWDEFLAAGPPANVQMPPSIAAAIRAFAERRRAPSGGEGA